MLITEFDKFPKELQTRIDCVQGRISFALESRKSLDVLLAEIKKLLAPVDHNNLAMRWETAGIVGNALISSLERIRTEANANRNLSARFHLATDGEPFARQALVSGFEEIAARYATDPEMCETIVKLRERYDPAVREARAGKHSADPAHNHAPANCGPAPAGR